MVGVREEPQAEAPAVRLKGTSLTPEGRGLGSGRKTEQKTNEERTGGGYLACDGQTGGQRILPRSLWSGG